MSRPIALIVDDEPDIRELLELTLMKMDVASTSAENLTDARHALEQQQFDLCLADMRLPDGNGLDLVRYINSHYPNLPVAMITAHGNMETAVAALKAGAFDFISKPVDLPVLRKLVSTALMLTPNAQGDATCSADGSDKDCPLQGNSKVMQDIRRMITKLGRSQAPVYISGESGTGKELAARLIHQRSPRSSQAFVAVNCGAIPHELIESELFGHKKGSFTGAIADKEGLFEAARQGTLFLDEVADLPLSLQVKLLRVIQEKVIRPVGSAKEIRTDVRIISATHKDLQALVQKGGFRQDLYYRLNVIELPMPPLRERPEDTPELIGYLLERIARDYGQTSPDISSLAIKALQYHSFPGNVRELENALERAFALCEGNVIQLDDLGIDQHLPPTSDTTDSQPQSGEGLEDYLARIEMDILKQTLEATRWNRTAAAKKLGISFRALRYRLSKLGLGEE
jgi:two-component system response regulator PilR (NtrC family)